ncbi:RNA-guided endonuclease InsQ/TnpB family protein [Nonomuraea helvata]|uniref:RNA-guided endonuclease InsQ/TnpB family protein n=1 Tax=Nonomuraea helvata TaxID=37484 RepID=A0ABV5S1Z1_9ACTN
MELEKRSRAHVARLDLDARQSAVLDGQAHNARALWNLLHEYFTFRQGRFASLKDCDESIRAARKEIGWLKDLPAQAAQAVLKAYRQAWKNFFNPDHPARRPTFKSRFRSRMAVDVPQARDLNITRINRRWGAVTIPKLGRVRFRWTKDLPGVTRGGPDRKITGARLVKEANGWHIVFRTQTSEPLPAPHAGPATAIDRGIAVPLALATGEKVRHRKDWLTDGEQQRLLRLERKAARQKRAATPGQIARLRAKAKRRAIDWQHQTTAQLTDRFSLIVLEDLKVKNMMASASGTLAAPGKNVAQKRGLNRAIASQAWGRTAEFLTYKATAKGGKVVVIPAPGTSQECHACHTITKGSRQSQSRFVCKNTACGWIGNADVNAARTQMYRYTSAAGQAVTGRGGPAPLGPAKRQAPHGGTTHIAPYGAAA